MNRILKAFSYVFHPLWLPLAVVMYYFIVSPRDHSNALIYAKLFAISILTVIIPILSFYMLKNLQLVKTIRLETTRERIYPLLLQGVFTLLIIFRIFEGYEFPELHYFFFGAVATTLGCLLMALIKVKASLHMASLSGVLFFIIGLSLYFKTSLLLHIAILLIITGATASSRLILKAHSPLELIIGFLLGSIPQILLYTYWT